MLVTVVKNRPGYDILVLVLTYPEKRSDIEASEKNPIVDEDSCNDEDHSSEIDSYYNVRDVTPLRRRSNPPCC